METVKINTLELENVKRIRAVALEPTLNGLTVIGGNNNQGKTSVLDAIAWALGGDRYRPSNPGRDGSTIPPHIRITLSNGLVVERSGKTSALKVTDPKGSRRGQQLLNSFVEELALDLPKFLEQPSRDKARTLLQIIGVGDKLVMLERKEAELYNRRRVIGQEADRKRKYALEMAHYPDAPKEPVSALELIRRQQDILAINGENRRKRFLLEDLERQEVALRQKIQELNAQYAAVQKSLNMARLDAQDLEDLSTAQIEVDLENIEAINIKVRANMDRERAEQEAQAYAQKYEDMTGEIEAVRKEKLDLLNGAALPLEGLSVENGELTYQGKQWDGMSGSDQLKVATAIVRAVKPQCGFVLVDKLEQMDMATLREFGAWAQSQGLQAIATRVSTGDECSVIIEDGRISGQQLPPIPESTSWKAGVF